MLKIKEYEMNGTDVEVTIPETVDTMAIQALGDDVDVRVDPASDADSWTLVANRGEYFASKRVAASQQTLVFNGPEGSKVQIWYEMGGEKGMFGF